MSLQLGALHEPKNQDHAPTVLSSPQCYAHTIVATTSQPRLGTSYAGARVYCVDLHDTLNDSSDTNTSVILILIHSLLPPCNTVNSPSCQHDR
jgi:hypothetical protein